MQSRRGFLKRLAAAPVLAAAAPAIASALVTAEQLRFPAAPPPAPPVEYIAATSGTSTPMFSQPEPYMLDHNGRLFLPRRY